MSQRGIQIEQFDVHKLRDRLSKMTNEQLVQTGCDAKFMCSLGANYGKPRREVFVITLLEARAEYRRRHPTRERVLITSENTTTA